MKLSDEQLKKLRKPFDSVGAFEGYSEEAAKKILEDIMEIYLTLANINLRIKQEQQKNGEK